MEKGRTKKFLDEVRGLPSGELRERARGLAEELMKLRFRKASGQLEQAFRIKQVKRDLARVLTVMNSSRANG